MLLILIVDNLLNIWELTKINWNYSNLFKDAKRKQQIFIGEWSRWSWEMIICTISLFLLTRRENTANNVAIRFVTCLVIVLPSWKFHKLKCQIWLTPIGLLILWNNQCTVQTIVTFMDLIIVFRLWIFESDLNVC